MKTHEIKTHVPVFDAIRYGRKNFEFRKNDCDFEEGDTVVLKEYLPNLSQFTGVTITAKVGFVLRGPSFGVPDEFCVFSLLDIKCNI